MDQAVSKRKENKDNTTFLSILFLITPILDIYSFGVANLSFFSLGIVCLYGFLHGVRVKETKTFVICVLLILLHEIILFLRLGGLSTGLNTLIGMAIFAYAIVVFSSELDINRLYKVWKIVGAIFMIGLLFQCLNYYVLGREVEMLKIPFLPLTKNDQYTDILFELRSRPSSFFTEASHYASFMLPLLFLNFQKRDFLYAAANLTLIVLSTSSMGILLGFGFLAYFTLKSSHLYTKISLGVIAILFIYLFITSDLFEFARNKILVSGQMTDESSSLRLLFSLEVWRALPFSTKLLGIDAYSLGDFLQHNSNYIPDYLSWVLKDDSSITYASSFWYVAIKYGLVIWAVYIFMYFELMKKSFKSPFFIYALAIFLSAFIQSCWLNQIFLTQIIPIFLFIKATKYSNNEKRLYCNNIVRK